MITVISYWLFLKVKYISKENNVCMNIKICLWPKEIAACYVIVFCIGEPFERGCAKDN